MKFIIILLSLFLMLSCQKNTQTGKKNTGISKKNVQVGLVSSLNFFAMGTPLSIKYISNKKNKALEKKIINFINKFDKENSFYKKNSYISQINNLNDNEEIKVPLYFCNLLKNSKDYLIKTEGKFNITYKSPKKFRNFNNLQINCKKDSNNEFNSVIKVIKKGTILDTGGIAKGLAIDKTGDLLKKEGYNNFLINYGGDILVCGKKPNKKWKIGIKNPLNPSKLLKVISKNSSSCYSIATSGDYERYTVKNGKKLSHIINPKTGKSINGAHSITVIAKNASLADTLATAISVGHKDKTYIKRMKDKFNLEVYLLTGKDLRLREIK